MKALICGVGGQDGSYLAQLLLQKGYEVIGSSRDAHATTFPNLQKLGIREQVRTVSMAANDFRSVFSVLRTHHPDEIYNLAGQSSVGLSFEQPVETLESILVGTLNLLEAIRFDNRPIKFYNAGSSEAFGDTGDHPANESTPFRPRSPYAVAKASARDLVLNYREAYGLFACTGILFNHESPLRPPRFVTRKIVAAAARIAAGSDETLSLGNIEIQRDWGWAPEYVEAMWRMLQLDEPQDLVIATGRTISLEQFVALAFRFFGLDWHSHVSPDASLLRPTDIMVGRADPSQALRVIDWKAQYQVEQVVEAMCRAELNGRVSSPRGA